MAGHDAGLAMSPLRGEQSEPGMLPGGLLEGELSRELHNSGIAVTGNLAKGT